jgi:aminopeptidase C
MFHHTNEYDLFSICTSWAQEFGKDGAVYLLNDQFLDEYLRVVNGCSTPEQRSQEKPPSEKG